MLLTTDAYFAAHYTVCDCTGTPVPYVYSFDTESKEIELLVSIGKDADSGRTKFLTKLDSAGVHIPVKVKTLLTGAYVAREGREIENIGQDITDLEWMTKAE